MAGQSASSATTPVLPSGFADEFPNVELSARDCERFWTKVSTIMVDEIKMVDEIRG